MWRIERYGVQRVAVSVERGDGDARVIVAPCGTVIAVDMCSDRVSHRIHFCFPFCMWIVQLYDNTHFRGLKSSFQRQHASRGFSRCVIHPNRIDILIVKAARFLKAMLDAGSQSDDVLFEIVEDGVDVASG
jgi:hypothetical protein